jgi:hypothetical protein
LNNGLQKKIEFEMEQINRLLNEAEPLLILCRTKTPDFMEMSAAALCLHSFYNGIENILLLIIKQENLNIPEGEKWHRKLFERAFEPTAASPAIFRGEIKETLSEFLKFRHFVRHAYGFKLKWVEMEDLVNGAEKLWGILKEDINSFITSN